jgi:ketosteroid isomerase-like protein
MGKEAVSQLSTGTVVVQTFMAHVNKGDLPGALAYIHPDIRISEPPSMPYGGDYEGYEGFKLLMGKIEQTWASWRETPNRFAETEGLVFRACTVRGRLRASGHVVEMPFVEMFEIEHELIIRVRPHYWDAALLKQQDRTAEGGAPE